MAVLFPTPAGYMLNPARSAEMIQGFLNIEAAEGSTNGRLTQAQLQDYQQKHANVIDANTAVANYLSTGFNTIAKQTNESDAISIDDLVTLRKNLPTAPPVNNPPLPQMYSNGGVNSGYGSYNPGASGQNASQAMLALMMQMFQMMVSLMTNNSQ